MPLDTFWRPVWSGSEDSNSSSTEDDMSRRGIPGPTGPRGPPGQGFEVDREGNYDLGGKALGGVGKRRGEALGTDALRHEDLFYTDDGVTVNFNGRMVTGV